jgi:hypothetical protein
MIQLSKEQAAVAAAAVLPRVHALRGLLDNPALQLPDDIIDWRKVHDQLTLHTQAFNALKNFSSEELQ